MPDGPGDLPPEGIGSPWRPLLVFSSMVSFQELSKTKNCFVGTNGVKIGHTAAEILLGAFA